MIKNIFKIIYISLFIFLITSLNLFAIADNTSNVDISIKGQSENGETVFIMKNSGSKSLPSIPIEINASNTKNIQISEDMTISSEQLLQYTSYLVANKEDIINKTAIDVSEWQGDIDWKKVKESGINYAIIRLGYSGKAYGETHIDEKFQYNIEEAIKNNIKVGVYYFSQATTEEDIMNEVNLCLESLKKYNISLPVYFDMEWSKQARANYLSVEKRTELTKLFCEEVIKNGYNAGIYGNESFFQNSIIFSEIEKYDIWIANYTEKDIDIKPIIFSHRYDIFQYTCKGTCNGIDGEIDKNILHKIY